MSTWISERGARRGALCAALLLALPGCLALGPQRPQKPLTKATLGTGAVRLSAPRGYCIDSSSLRRLARNGGFALLAPCTQLTGTPGMAATRPRPTPRPSPPPSPPRRSVRRVRQRDLPMSR
jgi:hypothetical protein